MEILSLISPTGARVKILNTAEDYEQCLAEQLVGHLRLRLESSRFCSLALTGGNSPRGLYRRLGQEPWVTAIDWSQLKIFFGDDRTVGPTHPDSNFGMAWELWLKNGPIPHRSIFRMEGEKDDLSAAAHEYAAILERELPQDARGCPSLDLILLGLGADGHTASLFPGTAGLKENDLTVIANKIPQLKTSRLTMTYPILNAAQEVWFIAPGESKAERVAQILGYRAGGDAFPAAAVNPASVPLLWWLDRASAALIPAP
jgi:6-phosphogluconolactonase